LSGVVAETKMVGGLVALPVSLQDAPIMQLLQATRSHYETPEDCCFRFDEGVTRPTSPQTVLDVYGFQVETTSCWRSAPPASVAPLLQRVDATSDVSLRLCGPRSVAPVCCRAPQTEDKVKAKFRGVKRLVIEVRNTGDVLPSSRAMMLGVECSSVELRVAPGSFVCLDFVLVAQW